VVFQPTMRHKGLVGKAAGELHKCVQPTEWGDSLHEGAGEDTLHVVRSASAMAAFPVSAPHTAETVNSRHSPQPAKVSPWLLEACHAVLMLPMQV
jgi:hypothetical protein